MAMRNHTVEHIDLHTDLPIIPNAILVGTPGDDTITGNAAADMISGLDGNDTLFGGDGADSLSGGSSDRIDLSKIHISAADHYTIAHVSGGTAIDVDLGGNGTIDVHILAAGASVASGDIIWG